MTHRIKPRQLLLAMALALPPGMAAAQDTPPKAPAVQLEAAWGLPLPGDKAYAQLTPEQQRTLKSRYVEMGEGDEPPFPADGLGPLVAAISKAAEVAGGAPGKLEMEVFVNDAGTATKVEVIRTPDPRLVKPAATVAMLTRFKPALCKGRPCAMGFPVSIDFVRR